MGMRKQKRFYDQGIARRYGFTKINDRFGDVAESMYHLKMTITLPKLSEL